MFAHLASANECLERNSSRNNNSSNASVPAVSATDPGVNMTPYLIITCVLAYLNAITNGFSLVVFALDRKNLSMRRLLLLLSLSETVLNTSMAANISAMLSVGSQRLSFASFAPADLITGLFFVTFMLFNAYIMIRNWCLVLIAGSRCEAVRNPLSSRSGGQALSPQRTLLAYAGISALSLGVYTPRMFEFTWTVYGLPCDGGNSTTGSHEEYLLTTRVHHILDAMPAYGYYKTMLLFPMQTVLPIFLIAGLSFLIIVTLRRRRLQQQRDRQPCQAAARNSSDAATKTVMVLMLTFITCELPTFVFFVLNRAVFPDLPNYPAVRVHTTFIGNILVCLDSFSNFIIYSSTSNSFRDTVRRIFRLPPGSKSNRSANAPSYLAMTAQNPRLSRASGIDVPPANDNF